MNIFTNLIYHLIKFYDKNFHQVKIKKFLKNKINTSFPIIDVGSFHGEYVDIFYNKSNKFYLFEPHKKNFNFLKKKYINKKNIKIFPYAISNFNGVYKFNIANLSSTSSLKEVNKKSAWYQFKKFVTLSENFIKTYNVEVKKLDQIHYIKNLKKIGLIKIDTEGNDYNVLLGARKTIKKTKFIIIEIQNNKLYKNYDRRKIDNFFKKEKFVLKKEFRFYFTSASDRIYMNKNI